MKNLPKFSLSAVSLAVLGVIGSAAQAQEIDTGSQQLEEIVVTGVARQGVTKLEASVSVSSIDDSQIEKLAPRSTAEIFRGLPGIRAESSGGGGNANITIRGIPLATGGSKYTQIHEDGLPVLEFGDINFGNTDNFIRADRTIARIESVRGGSASTVASNSPGGIINMISKTGGEGAGGSVGLSVGLDYEEFRTDFEYGGSLNGNWDYHVGGFYRSGEGVRETGFDGDQGGQIKANITREFEGGYFRGYLKLIDDSVTTYLPAPVTVDGGGSYSPVPGFDASSEALHPGDDGLPYYDVNGNIQGGRSIEDGIETEVTAVGFEFQNEFSNGLRLTNKFRTSSIEGGFISPFTDGFAGGTAPIGVKGLSLCGAASISGMAVDCSAGVTALVDGAPANLNQLGFTNLQFDTSFDDLGLTVNDLRLAWENDSVSLSGGLYISDQTIKTSWNGWHTRLQTVDGGNSQGIQYIANADGTNLSGPAGEVTLSFLQWAWDLDYKIVAPYLNLGFNLGDNVSIDMSVRRDDVEARGSLRRSCCGGNTTADQNGDGVINPLLDSPSGVSAGFITGGIGRLSASPELVNYDTDHTSYSLGGTYVLSDNSSVFARVSEGGRAIGDRLLQIGGALLPNGALNTTTDGVDSVQQTEIGYKFLGESSSFFVTLFDTDTEETGAEITSGATFEREYNAKGIELDGHVSWDNGFSVRGNMTWTDAEISADRTNASVVGNKPRRQADVIYTITPEYSTERFNFGATLQGSSSYFLQDNNDLEQKAYVIVNLFGNYDINDNLTAFFTVNNLTDEFVLTEAEEGSAGIGSFIRARPLSGTSTSVGITYRF